MSFAARVALIALVPAAVAAAAPEPPQAIQRMMTAPIQFDLSPPLASIVPLPVVPGAFREIPERGTGNEGRLGPRDVDPVVQTRVIGPATEIPSPSVSFNGPPNISDVSPPDPVGDVGPNHYIAMSNNSFQIFNKAGTSLFGPAANNTLWAGFGGAVPDRERRRPRRGVRPVRRPLDAHPVHRGGSHLFRMRRGLRDGRSARHVYSLRHAHGHQLPRLPEVRRLVRHASTSATREFAGGGTVRRDGRLRR